MVAIGCVVFETPLSICQHIHVKSKFSRLVLQARIDMHSRIKFICNPVLVYLSVHWNRVWASYMASPPHYLTTFLRTGMSSGADNRGIFDDGSAQRLTVEAVSEMKGEGVSGQVSS